MTDFDFSQIMTIDASGDVCGPDGCLPTEGKDETTSEPAADGQDA